MYWLRRPPYLRWIAAGIILMAGLAMDLRGGDVESYPFSAEAIPAGELVDSAVEWRDLPSGALPKWTGPVSGFARYDIASGDPLLPSSLAHVVVPDGWWSVAIPLPVVAAPGTWLRVRYGSATDLVDGIVISSGDGNSFEQTSMVAFPEETAPKVASAAADDALVVMVGHNSGAAPPAG